MESKGAGHRDLSSVPIRAQVPEQSNWRKLRVSTRGFSEEEYFYVVALTRRFRRASASAGAQQGSGNPDDVQSLFGAVLHLDAVDASRLARAQHLEYLQTIERRILRLSGATKTMQHFDKTKKAFAAEIASAPASETEGIRIKAAKKLSEIIRPVVQRAQEAGILASVLQGPATDADHDDSESQGSHRHHPSGIDLEGIRAEQISPALPAHHTMGFQSGKRMPRVSEASLENEGIHIDKAASAASSTSDDEDGDDHDGGDDGLSDDAKRARTPPTTPPTPPPPPPSVNTEQHPRPPPSSPAALAHAGARGGKRPAYPEQMTLIRKRRRTERASLDRRVSERGVPRLAEVYRQADKHLMRFDCLGGTPLLLDIAQLPDFDANLDFFHRSHEIIESALASDDLLSDSCSFIFPPEDWDRRWRGPERPADGFDAAVPSRLGAQRAAACEYTTSAEGATEKTEKRDTEHPLS
eukprot:scaffold719_cov226-Pinguiococcus_pyrenoidosus.AAC.9